MSNSQIGTPAGAAHPSLGWVPVAGLGIAIAVSGNFSGWNLGLQEGGWGGMMVAALIMAVFYLCLTQCVAELAAAFPQAAGLDDYAGRGLGPEAGFIAGMGVLLPRFSFHTGRTKLCTRLWTTLLTRSVGCR